MWFEGLRFYLPLLGTTALTVIVGGVLMLIAWLVIVSRWLSTVAREVPKGVFEFSTAVVLPALGFLMAQAVSSSATNSDLYVLIWWLFIIGSFVLLLRARKQFANASGAAANIAASGTEISLMIEGLGMAFQILALVVR